MDKFRLAAQFFVVAPMTFMMVQQRTQTICNPKLIAVFARLEKLKGPIGLQGCEILSFHWIREKVQIEVTIVRPNFHVNISEQFTILKCMRPSFKRSINMDRLEDVDEDDYLRKEVSCSKTGINCADGAICSDQRSLLFPAGGLGHSEPPPVGAGREAPRTPEDPAIYSMPCLEGNVPRPQ